VNPRWIPALADHMEVAAKVKRKPGVAYSALVPNMRGLDGATRSGMKEVAVFMAATETHNRKNINKSTDEALQTYRAVVGEAQTRGIKVRGYVSCVYGCPYEGTVAVEQVQRVGDALLDMGVYELSLGDTIGVGTPRQVEYILRSLLEGGIPLPKLAVHFHDTRGTALANIVVALQHGVRTIDCAVGGLGGCPYAPGASGNVATEDVVYMLQGMGVNTGVDLDKLVSVSTRLGAQLGRELPSKYLKAHIGHCARLGVPV
jgi:hydroxymethylglutaryl-CoA lyase